MAINLKGVSVLPSDTYVNAWFYFTVCFCWG